MYDALRPFAGRRFTFRYKRFKYSGVFQRIGSIANWCEKGYCHHGMIFTSGFQCDRPLSPALAIFVHPEQIKCIEIDGLARLRRICRQIFNQNHYVTKSHCIYIPKHLVLNPKADANATIN